MSSIQRSHALDNLRISLTALVIVHHAAIPYGGAGSWLYTSPHHTPGSSIPVLAFNVINQTFFMATFFLLSAYFSSIAAQRRTRRAFLWEKWKRLGVPTAVYSVISKGVVRGIITWRLHDAGWAVVWKEVLEGVKGVRGVSGPVWYCALLLIFDTLYAVLFPSQFTEAIPTPRNAMPSSKAPPFRTTYVLIALSSISVMSFLVRTEYPVGLDFKPLCLQLAFVSQYALYYIAGICIHRSDRTLQEAIIPRTLRHLAALAIGVTTFSLFQIKSYVTSGGVFIDVVEQATGGVNLFALLYAFWNEVTGLLLSSVLLKLFTSHRMLGKKWQPFGVDLGKYSYASFLVHTPLLVDMQCFFGKGEFEKRGAVFTAMTVGMLGVVESWGVGWLLKEGVDRLVGRGYV
ncbi:uncharacterized protein K460DRAFT_400817 [Cucurbitaria berberidis CBS 394.84]|uniref:Acyltransferase 3 domain-containing protein n=1 Tax=Cucurbitaria berberidis CBS 394.84 TaxID=1168544 RepID=A0A9P4GT32_9PLEO|nr:uncharacterized protein K460DRAFT_400817 [Cucurbitaria berberidis CBS 394.84]KAF1850779.1 hypothetical protein K460DRAFT_400817 [Cucurbitaria berberidis CBS 394.84]